MRPGLSISICSSRRSWLAVWAVFAAALTASHARSATSRDVSPLLRAAAAEVARASSSARAASVMVREVGPAGMVRADGAGRLHVFVYVSRADAAARDALALAGAEVELVSERAGAAPAWAPAAGLDAIAALPFVRRISPPIYAVAQSGGTQTQGDAIHRADLLRARGVTGQGARVGAISDGALGFQASRDAGDLPGDVAILRPGDGNEGTVLMEIVHDLAPGAKLGFCSGPSGRTQTILDFADCASRLVDEWGASVIVDDVNFLGTSWFEDGIDAVAVSEAIAKGAVWVSAAANFGDSHYQARFTDAGDALRSHDFGGGDVTMPVHVPVGGMSVYLQWANPFESVTDDYAVCLVSQAEGVADTCSKRFDTANPFEVVSLPCVSAEPCDVEIAIRRESGESREVELYFSQRVSYGPTQYGTRADSFFGHPAVTEAVAVAAINAVDEGHDDITTYSGEGPITVFFPAPETRAGKPEVSGIDCVSISPESQFRNPFCGTSASAPHVAGVAALLRGAFASASAGDVRRALIDGGTATKRPGDETAGQGAPLVDAERSAELLEERVGSTPIATITEPSGDVTVRAGQTVTFSGTCTDPFTPDGLAGRWSFDAASGVSPIDGLTTGAVTFSIAGTHTVSFTCTNSAGASDPTRDTRSITVRSSGGGGGGCNVGDGAPSGTFAALVGAASLLLATHTRHRRAGGATRTARRRSLRESA